MVINTVLYDRLGTSTRVLLTFSLRCEKSSFHGVHVILACSKAVARLRVFHERSENCARVARSVIQILYYYTFVALCIIMCTHSITRILYIIIYACVL